MWLAIVGPQAFRSQSHSWAIGMGLRACSSCLEGTGWQSDKPKGFPTTWLVFWLALWMSGSIWDSCGHTELRPFNWRPWGNAATVSVNPRWPIALDHKCRNSVKVKTTSGRRNWPDWEPRKHPTGWGCVQWQIHLHSFEEWSAGPDENVGGSVPPGRSFSVWGTPFWLAESVAIWLDVSLSCLLGLPMVSLVIRSEEGSPWDISRWIIGRSSWTREARRDLSKTSGSASHPLWTSCPTPPQLHQGW